MDTKIKCSSMNHKENEAIIFCQECKIYMCKKCESFHSELFQKHNQFKLSAIKSNEELFTGLCMEKSHFIELKFFCKDHNKLCCSECITKIKSDEYGQHTDCTICSLKDIKQEKLNKLKDNIKELEDLSKNINESITEIKLAFEKIEEDKEKLKTDIQSIFTKIRNLLNNKEDEILQLIDTKYEEIYIHKDYIIDIEKLPEKINKSIEKGKLIQNNNETIKLNSLINDCLNLENNIFNINKINSNIKDLKTKQNKKYFIKNQKAIEQVEEIINNSKFLFSNVESEIINEKNFLQINEWLGGNHNFFLKYSAKRDGCNTDIFHQNCDNISGCVIICKPINHDIIGGYISSKIFKVINTKMIIRPFCSI